jgi:uncharacterized protein with beta-barrel porin domain
MVTKAPPIVYVPHWDVWGAAFGGVNNTHGDNVAGTSDLYTRVGGVAAGADYRFAPDSLVGFSLAGGNINWSLTTTIVGGSLGGGASDTFMAGIYGKYGFGQGYLSGAATYTNYWMNTTRNSGPGVADTDPAAPQTTLSDSLKPVAGLVASSLADPNQTIG